MTDGNCFKKYQRSEHENPSIKVLSAKFSITKENKERETKKQNYKSFETASAELSCPYYYFYLPFGGGARIFVIIENGIFFINFGAWRWREKILCDKFTGGKLRSLDNEVTWNFCLLMR